MRLNLGSNNIKYEGFTNVDIRDIPEVDIVDDVVTLRKIEDNSVEEIKAHNIIGQLASDNAEKALKVWFAKMKHGASLEIGATDGELIFGKYLKGIYDWPRVVHGIFGNIGLLRQWHGDDAERWMGHSIYTQDYLTKLLNDVGFVEVSETTPNHADVITLRCKKP